MITFEVQGRHEAVLVIKALSGVIDELVDTCKRMDKTAAASVINEYRARLWEIERDFENQMAEQLYERDEPGEEVEE
jgi:aspartokinase